MSKINDSFPILDVSIVLNGEISQTSTEELVKDKNVVLVGVPGAFTPTCHVQHLPGYIENIDTSKDIIFSYVCFKYESSDSFVLNKIDLTIESGKFIALVGNLSSCFFLENLSS